ncbi:ABC-type multidrug transport system, ATPase and permease component [Hathewaya proteolytica DSM 3090]|uniref:ABC-type multidrug transport system, ATPase and permease component n=1 Tax=Hathewaya proteolytica DSM 3090 TaxID=1121331 RepID=A0A1M6MRL0_9CLOT|nr:ABC transporter ATP-binding protein [Hathewaya proteolytica]SHJ86052.1 ABC-type multidrug transport system, ATPase and permease component [Hathewaya proteolytica DSM 3090]
MKKYILNVKKYIIMELMLGILAAICVGFIPNCEKLLLDNIALLQNRGALINIILLFAACGILGCIFSYMSSLMNIKWTSSMRCRLQTDFFDALADTSYEEFKKKAVGDYVSMETNNTDVVVDEYIKPFLNMVQAILKVIVYAIIMFLCIDWKISLLIFALSFFTIFIPKIFEKKNKKLGQLFMKATENYTTSVKDYLEGIKLINNKTRRAIIEQHNHVVNKTISQKIKSGTFVIFSMCMEVTGIKIVELIVFIFVVILLLKGQMTAGMALAVFTYSSYFVSPLQDTLNSINSINSRKGIAKEYMETMEHYNTHKIRNCGINDHKKCIECFKNSIKFENVCIQREQFKMDHINLEFEKGKKYVIIGHSGSGKTTILNLLMGYEKLDSGCIKIDGNSIEESNTDGIMGCISQKDHIFSDSFKNNVTVFGSYGEEQIEKGTLSSYGGILQKICHKSDCSDLSGGEKQITSLLRALTADKDIILMDEPFSDLDVVTYKKAMDTVMELEDKTIIMVTHNLDENLQRFDKIISMDNGKVIEERQLS